MPMFVLLHEHDTGREILVNVDSVDSFTRRDEGRRTVINFRGGHSTSVRESLATIQEFLG